MKNLIIAWRNLWRNKRRTLITTASILFGVLFSTIMSSLQEGTYSKMIDNMVKTYTGYIQIMNDQYWDKKSINHLIQPSDSLIQDIHKIEEIKQVIPRLQHFTLLSTGNNTKGSLVIGIDPEKEQQMTNLKQWLHKGEYLKNEDQGVLITYNLARVLQLGINDTVILLSQGYHGATAAGMYPIRGILKFPSPQMNDLGIYMDIGVAQQLFSAYGKYTSLVINLEGYSDLKEAEEKTAPLLPDGYNMMNWREMQPDLVSFIEADRAGAALMKAILYLVIGFGIFGTVTMMMAERRRELGVMVAVGMHKMKLATILVLETLYIGILGVISGFIISIPVILFFVNNPLPLPDKVAEAYMQFGIEPFLFFSMAPKVFTYQILAVFIITIIITTYPALRMINFNAIKAIRS